MLRAMRLILFLLLALFVVPTLATAAWWAALDRPHSWREAQWTSSGILPPPGQIDGPAIFVLAARTGGMKGAVSVHSWIVIRKPGADSYERYDKVGWGNAIRVNGWAADGSWYSNPPAIVTARTGADAAAILPRVVEAIASYPHAGYGAYRIWPGPNSNSFVAHVLREVPELGAVLPPNAVGRDYAPGLFSARFDKDGRDLHVTLGGLFGFAVGARSGIEVHLLGLVAGIDIARPALKIPALGLVGCGRSTDQRPQAAGSGAASTTA